MECGGLAAAFTVAASLSRTSGKLGEPRLRSRERRLFFAESKADLVSAVASIIVKAGTGNRGHANLLHQVFRERNIFCSGGKANWIRIGKARNVGHDVIRAARLENSEAGKLQNLQQARAFLRVVGGQPVTLYVLDMPLITMVRSRMPSMRAMEMCSAPSYKMCS